MDPTIIFVKGKPDAGKSSVAHSLSKSRIVENGIEIRSSISITPINLFKLDLGDIYFPLPDIDSTGKWYNNGIVKEAKKDKLGKLIKKYGKGDKMMHFYGEVDGAGLSEEYADILMDKFKDKSSPFIVDGAISDYIFEFLTKKLIAKDYRVWSMWRDYG